MLRLENISKTYVANSNKVRALRKVSINFRKNEFVSILGPSGSGKTTLLNIIGGLDKYTKGDLIIVGKSTKEFKDRDWDYYRNQRIGFIFQSYNLIPHQTVLANVELALTISGVGKKERIQRAKEALDKVGLSDQYYKKPNQLSGGQCQRVAIARALVNNPEILLADEPTGALDTKTSEQIMMLIKEISKDRLVIMVTHNPDLARRYSNRIISLLDGKIVQDTNPYSTDKEIVTTKALSKNIVDKKSKAKMGLLTANKLSFRNLISKRGRTILVSIASSIGIIGVSTVLSVSFGVTNYVASMQDDMLSSYPLEISERSIDLTSLMTGLNNDEKQELAKFDVKTQVGMESMITFLMDKYSDFTKIATNDINDDLISYIENIPSKDIAATQYHYGIDVTNNIFTNWTTSEIESNKKEWVSLNGLTQRYISELKTVDGFSSYATYVNLFTNFMKEIPGDEEYTLNQYDLLGSSTFATAANEMMLVVNKDSTLTDLLLGQLGIYDHDEFINIGRKAVEIYKKGTDSDVSTWGLKRKLDEKVITKEEYDAEYQRLSEEFPYRQILNYEDIIGKEFYYLPHSSLWNYEKVSDDTSMEGSILLYNSNKIYNLRYDSTYASLGFDILSGDEINLVSPDASKKIILARKASASRDSDTFFDSDATTAISDPLSCWTEINSMTDLTPTGRVLDVKSTSKVLTFVKYNLSDILHPELEPFIDGVGGARVVLDAKETSVIEAYCYNIENNDIASAPQAVKMKISGILRAKDSTNFGSLSRGIYYTKALTAKYMSDAIASDSKIINEELFGFKAQFKNGQALTKTFGAYCKYSFIDYTDEDNPFISTKGYAYALNGDLSNSIGSLFSSVLGSASSESANKTYFRSLTGLKVDLNESSLSVNFEKLPEQIDIYPVDFASKNNVTNYLDRWNSDEEIVIGSKTIKPMDRTDLTYTDTVAMIINVINSLITIVTSALVAFTSLSLVVSCFMIAVITYISVMERVKEIGVIRSLGGRKKDVSRLFTAENFMTGLASGVIGVGVSYFLSLIINLVVHYFGAPSIAMLPWWMALIMIGLAIALNVISGFIPSKNAAKQDPVNALRSE